MPLTHPGMPVWTEGRGFRFENIAYPEYEAADAAHLAAYRAWHDTVGGNAELGIPQHAALARIHDDIKLRTNNPALAEPRVPFWNAQATVIGFHGVPPSDPALIDELKRAYATHVGTETEALVSASKTLHEHRLNLSRSQLGVLRNTNTLPGLENELFLGTAAHPGGMKAAHIREMERDLTHTQAAITHSEQYLREMPALRGVHAPTPQAPAATNGAAPHAAREAEGWMARVFREHPKKSWGTVAAGAAAVIGAGYWAFKSKGDKAEGQQPGAGTERG